MFTHHIHIFSTQNIDYIHIPITCPHIHTVHLYYIFPYISIKYTHTTYHTYTYHMHTVHTHTHTHPSLHSHYHCPCHHILSAPGARQEQGATEWASEELKCCLWLSLQVLLCSSHWIMYKSVSDPHRGLCDDSFAAHRMHRTRWKWLWTPSAVVQAAGPAQIPMFPPPSLLLPIWNLINSNNNKSGHCSSDIGLRPSIVTVNSHKLISTRTGL